MMEKLNFEKMNGLLPVVVQDADDGTVLMLGFMNREALERTINEQQVVFWSRTKSRLWKKGETSGNFMNVVSISPDCDNDSILILAHPTGPVCHTGEKSCFQKSSMISSPILQQLEKIIQSRKKEMPDGSYTTTLFRDGISRIAQKVGEEAVELTIAAQYNDTQRIIEETADVLYHTLVLLAEKGITLGEVYDELGHRMKK
jgi:phosphoribosyl-ATP pyrophosphohydrolase/phosphoribosyl-AMP cyclohydrolase